MTLHRPGARNTLRRPPKLPRPEPAPRVPVPALPKNHRTQPWPLISENHDDAGAGTATVTFLYESRRAKTVLLFVNRLTDERDITRSEMEYFGDGLWALSYRMDTDWRASYAFLEHTGCGEPPWRTETDQRTLRTLLDSGRCDPRNQLTCLNSGGTPFSVVELPDAPPQPHRIELRHPSLPQSAVIAAEHSVATASGHRRVWAHPVGRPGAAAPLVLLLDGETWLTHHRFQLSLDSARQAGELPDLWAVFISSGARSERWQYLGHHDGAARDLPESILPWAQRTLEAGYEPASTVVTGHSLGGISALWALAQHPESIGAVLAQSPSVWTDPDGALAAHLQQTSGRIRLEVGRQEWAMADQVRELADALGSTGAQVEYAEFNGGHDFACWRGGLIEGITALLAPR
ncbi:enterochelin esterase domain-containing protein [Nesterenkonia muleiensis]|uniref:enterochelin esterase domain-containing protein n=1 Tax=Nesterenkonia muleiensis TaxID=2282648 RepID=UPI000E72EC4B|nr:alpha/beta hydrolase-fold protein [Nesterenkonia muleiensis]